MTDLRPIIETKKLSFSYSGKAVLHDISFSIQENQTWSVIGKNGAGKSTLIKSLAGLLPLPHNTVFVNGIDIMKMKSRERAKVIAYVPQATGRALAAYTVFDFVMLGRFPYQGLMAIPHSRDKEIVCSALDLTDVADLSERLMTTLSGGELQRVFVAAAVAQQCRILLLDEPATFLDPLHQETIRMTLQRIHKEFGTTVITITHDVNAAIFRNSNVLALVDGGLFFAGPAHDFQKQCPTILESIYSIDFEQATCANSKRIIIVPGEKT